QRPDEFDAILRRWTDCVEHGDHASVFQHPELVLPRDGADQKLYLCEDADQSANPPLSSIAVFAPTSIKLSVLPGLNRPARRVRGLNLVGDTIAGGQDSATTSRILSGIARLLVSNQVAFVVFEVVREGTPLWEALWQLQGPGRGLRLRPFLPAQPHWRIEFP